MPADPRPPAPKRNSLNSMASVNRVRSGLATRKPSSRVTTSPSRSSTLRRTTTHGGTCSRTLPTIVISIRFTGIARNPCSAAAVVPLRKLVQPQCSCAAIARPCNESRVPGIWKTPGSTGSSTPLAARAARCSMPRPVSIVARGRRRRTASGTGRGRQRDSSSPPWVRGTCDESERHDEIRDSRARNRARALDFACGNRSTPGWGCRCTGRGGS